MADNMTPIDAHSVDDAFAGAPTAGGGKSGASRAGKLVIGGLLLILVLAVAAGAFFVFFGGSGSDELAPPAAPSSTNAAVAQSAPATTSVETTIAPVEPPQVPLTDVFTFRDIFEPLAKAPAVSTTTTSTTPSTGSPTGGTTTETSANTILLQDITSENGQPMAVVVWNGTTYTVAEGQQVDSSPWKVLDIQTDSVTMLYGDVQVQLSVGQAITK